MCKVHLSNIQANLESVGNKLEVASESAGRLAQDVSLIAVSKSQQSEKILEALRAGHRIFGENRIQEAKNKWPNLRDQYPDVEIHLIGALQTNKVAQAIDIFDVIQTVDRPKLANKIAQEMTRQRKRPNCFVQVNIGEEPQKAGVLPLQADAFIAECLGDYGLPICGLMCIPPSDEEPAPYFALLRKIALRNKLPQLSMGMSNDYETAVAFGATYVRVGTAVFGPR